MITCEDITVYVASRRSKPPKLPLREALVTVAVECVYETNKVAPGKRNKVMATLRKFLKGNDGKGLKCTHYGYAQDSKELAEMGLDSYLNASVAKTYANSNSVSGPDPENTRSTTSSLTMTLALLDVDKADSRRNRQRLWQQNKYAETGFQSIEKRAHGDMARKYKNAAQMAMMAAFTQDLEDPKDQVDFVFDIDEHMETSSFQMMDAPSLASTDDGTDNESLDDIEAMTVNTNVLVSGEDIVEIEAIHQAECLIADFDGKSTMLWIDDRDKMDGMSALLMDWKSPEDPTSAEKSLIERMEIGKRSTDIRIGREKNMALSRKKSNDDIMGQEFELNAEKNMIEDMSTIFDSTCSVMCPTYGAVTLPDDHDLNLMVHIEEDLKNLDNPGKKNINQGPKSLFPQPLLSNEHDLFGMLVDLTTKVEDVKWFLNDMPDALQHERDQDGRLPLHVLCDRCFESPSLLRLPDAKSEELHSTITSFIEEITQHRLLLKLLVWSYKDACLKLDANGDLAIHLLGRRLVEWTASLQIFTKLATMDVTHLERMMTLSQIVTESIDIVSRPLCSAKMNVCDKPGSCGSMLPLHINIIFGGSMDVFRLLLETFPQGVLTPFVFPEESFPISTTQLQKMIKSDQRIYRQKLSYAQNLSEGDDKPLSWHSTIPSNFYEEDIERRLDFLFCVDPESSLIEDEIRSNRIIRLIRDEVKQDIGLWKDGLSPSINNIWAWICNQESNDYVSYIEDIAKDLKKSHFAKLANAPLGNKPSSFDPVIVASRFEVRKALMHSKRVSEATCFSSHEFIENYEGDRNQNNLFSIRDHTSIADLAWATKAVFGIKAEDSQCIPIHFVVFPFPLENYESNEDHCINDQVSVAESKRKLDILFSNWMMNAISPGAVLAGLQEKITSSQPLNEPTSEVNTPLRKEQKSYKEDEEWGVLTSLYQNGGYLYFIDEEKGTIINKPSSGFSDTIVNSSNRSKETDVAYPIFLPDAAQQVQVLLPLMRMGMLLMRKTDSVSILSQVLIQHMEEKCDADTTKSNKNGNKVYSYNHPSSWTVVSRELILHLQEKANNLEYMDEKEESSIVILETNTMRNKLHKFLATPSIHSNQEVVGLDWSKELSLLKNIIGQTGHYTEMIPQLSIQKKKLSSIKDGYVWTASKRKGQDFDDEDIDEKLIGSEKKDSDVSKIITKPHDDLDSIINDVAYDDDDIFERLFAAQQETSDLFDFNHAGSSKKNIDYNRSEKKKLLTSSTVEDEVQHENRSIDRSESDGNFSQAKRNGNDDEKRYDDNNVALAQEWWK